MSEWQFNGVSLSALAQVSDEGCHLKRVLSFADGHQKVLGCLIGDDNKSFILSADSQSSERIEITQGECRVRMDDDDNEYYYREGQSFVVAKSSRVVLIPAAILQYVRHLEG